MELSSLFLAGKGSALTSFFSTAFLVVFLPFCLVVYSLMPRRGKKYFLLAADCAFFWLISGKLLVYLLLTALSMHYFGLWLDKIQSETKLLLAQTEKAERKTVRKRQQAVQHRILLLAVVLHIGVLFALKYSGFAATNVNTLLAHLHIPVQLAIPKYVMPIGISFFTLQALSYIVDVQRGVTKADTNLLRLTLFISFFPQVVEGPICRYDQTAQQLWDAKPITYENLTLGLQRIAYGMMKKVIIADRLNPLVRNVFNNYTDFDGGVIALAAVCYTVQLYMDFSGSMDAVTGTAQILGITMPENFRQPFSPRRSRNSGSAGTSRSAPGSRTMCSTRSSRSSRWKSSPPPPANASATTTVRCWRAPSRSFACGSATASGTAPRGAISFSACTTSC